MRDPDYSIVEELPPLTTDHCHTLILGHSHGAFLTPFAPVRCAKSKKYR